MWAEPPVALDVENRPLNRDFKEKKEGSRDRQMLQFKGRVKASAAWTTSPEKYTRGNTKVSTLGASG